MSRQIKQWALGLACLASLASQGNASSDEGENPMERARFRSLSLKSADGEYDPNRLIQAKTRMASMLGKTGARTPGLPSLNWTALGPGNIGGRVRSLLTHPTNPNILYLGSVSGGIWKTQDGGLNWKPLNDFIPNLAIGAMAMDPLNPDILYAGTGEMYLGEHRIRGTGIFKSTDGGQTWNQLPATANRDFWMVGRIKVHPTNPQILLATTNTGLFRSSNGGAEWTSIRGKATIPVDGKFYDTSFMDIDWSPSDGNKVLASSAYGIYWSTDAGITWTQSTGLTPGYRFEMATAKSSPNIVYASSAEGAGKLWKSTDGGKSFTLLPGGNGLLLAQGDYNNAIWVDPLNPNALVVGGIWLHYSQNGGESFTEIGKPTANPPGPGSIHFDQHFIVEVTGYSASNRGLYVANDGGIYKTDDVSKTESTKPFYSLNNGLEITQFYGAAGHPRNGMIIGGAQDNGNILFKGNSDSWVPLTDYDGGFVAADPELTPDGSSIWYVTFQHGVVNRVTLNPAGNISDIVRLSEPKGQTLFIAPIILDPNDPNRLYKGSSKLMRMDNARAASAATPWHVSEEWPSSISAIAVAPGNSNRVWIGTERGEIYATENSLATSPTWVRRRRFSGRFVTRIVIDPTHTNRVYVTLGGYNADNVWKSEDAGLSWTDITSNLPDVPVRSLAINKWNTNALYIGTEIGAFSSENQGDTWSPANSGLTHVSVDELFWVGNGLYAATHGRGIFKTQIDTAAAGNKVENAFKPASPQSQKKKYAADGSLLGRLKEGLKSVIGFPF